MRKNLRALSFVSLVAIERRKEGLEVALKATVAM